MGKKAQAQAKLENEALQNLAAETGGKLPTAEQLAVAMGVSTDVAAGLLSSAQKLAAEQVPATGSGSGDLPEPKAKADAKKPAKSRAKKAKAAPKAAPPQQPSAEEAPEEELDLPNLPPLAAPAAENSETPAVPEAAAASTQQLPETQALVAPAEGGTTAPAEAAATSPSGLLALQDRVNEHSPAGAVAGSKNVAKFDLKDWVKNTPKLPASVAVSDEEPEARLFHVACLRSAETWGLGRRRPLKKVSPLSCLLRLLLHGRQPSELAVQSCWAQVIWTPCL